MSFVIEKGIPTPPPGRGRGAGASYPFEDMGDIGDSFLVPLDESDDSDEANKLLVRRVRQAALGAGRKYAPAKFTVRKQADGVRVWRVA